MHESKIEFVKKPADNPSRLEPSTCTEAETFVLQVLDNSMEPEFAKHCMIVIDPTGHARDGSYVLARRSSLSKLDKYEPDNPIDTPENDATQVEQFHFRQLHQLDDQNWQLRSLNSDFPSYATPSDFSDIVGVIVQRAGTRRRYHKRYD